MKRDIEISLQVVLYAFLTFWIMCLLVASACGSTVTNAQGLIVGITNPLASVTLEWNPSPTLNVRTYNLYYGTVSRAYSTTINAGAATNITVNLQRGPTYFFAVTAVDLNFLESQFSNEAAYTPTNPPVSAVLTPVKTLVVDSKATITDPWQSSGMEWAISTSQAQQYYRLRIVSPDVVAIPGIVPSPLARPTMLSPPIPGK